jgi:hypothetical protein
MLSGVQGLQVHDTFRVGDHLGFGGPNHRAFSATQSPSRPSRLRQGRRASSFRLGEWWAQPE